MYKNFRDKVGFIETSSEKNAWIRKYSNYATLCDAVVEEIEKGNYQTLQQIADMVNEKFGIKVSIMSVSRLLKKKKSVS